MTIGPDLCYATGGLRAGAGTAQATADAAGELAGRVAGLVIEAAVFGAVDRAAPIAAALVAARDGVAALAGGVQQVHADLAQRAGAVAAAGDQLTADTTDRARRPAGGR